MARTARNIPSAAEHLAAITQQLAVLLEAGVTPTSAWVYSAEMIAEPGPDDAVVAVRAEMLRSIAQDVATGRAPGEAIREAQGSRGLEEHRAWASVAAAWTVATAAGSPLAPTLHALAGSLRDTAQTSRDLQIALAGPRATAKLVTLLPVIGILFGAALGFDTFHTLLATPFGWACTVVGVGLMLVARCWNKRLLRSAEPSSRPAGLYLDLLAIAVSGGASLDRAHRAADDALPADAEPTEQERAAASAVLALSARAGVPAALLLRSRAAEMRNDARAEGARRAAALGVQLMLPLGVCILPAFIVLGVAPLLVSVISSTVGAF